MPRQSAEMRTIHPSEFGFKPDISDKTDVDRERPKMINPDKTDVDRERPKMINPDKTDVDRERPKMIGQEIELKLVDGTREKTTVVAMDAEGHKILAHKAPDGRVFARSDEGLSEEQREQALFHELDAVYDEAVEAVKRTGGVDDVAVAKLDRHALIAEAFQLKNPREAVVTLLQKYAAPKSKPSKKPFDQLQSIDLREFRAVQRAKEMQEQATFIESLNLPDEDKRALQEANRQESVGMIEIIPDPIYTQGAKTVEARITELQKEIATINKAEHGDAVRYEALHTELARLDTALPIVEAVDRIRNIEQQAEEILKERLKRGKKGHSRTIKYRQKQILGTSARLQALNQTLASEYQQLSALSTEDATSAESRIQKIQQERKKLMEKMGYLQTALKDQKEILDELNNGGFSYEILLPSEKKQSGYNDFYLALMAQYKRDPEATVKAVESLHADASVSNFVKKAIEQFDDDLPELIKSMEQEEESLLMRPAPHEGLRKISSDMDVEAEEIGFPSEESARKTPQGELSAHEGGFVDADAEVAATIDAMNKAKQDKTRDVKTPIVTQEAEIQLQKSVGFKKFEQPLVRQDQIPFAPDLQKSLDRRATVGGIELSIKEINRGKTKKDVRYVINFPGFNQSIDFENKAFAEKIFDFAMKEAGRMKDSPNIDLLLNKIDSAISSLLELQALDKKAEREKQKNTAEQRRDKFESKEVVGGLTEPTDESQRAMEMPVVTSDLSKETSLPKTEAQWWNETGESQFDHAITVMYGNNQKAMRDSLISFGVPKGIMEKYKTPAALYQFVEKPGFWARVNGNAASTREAINRFLEAAVSDAKSAKITKKQAEKARDRMQKSYAEKPIGGVK